MSNRRQRRRIREPTYSHSAWKAVRNSTDTITKMRNDVGLSGNFDVYFIKYLYFCNANLILTQKTAVQWEVSSEQSKLKIA